MKKDFDKKLNNSLKSFGFLFPENEKQLESFLKEIQNIEIPENIKNCSEDFSFKREELTEFIFKDEGNLAVNYLAQAARKGGNIPQNILKKMEKDRDNI
ncbi:hypothetical protein DSECCO2_634250 [anaerobic digester metagenome]